MPPKKTPEKYPRTEQIIRFQDCDPLGHLNNTRYIDYFYNTRMDHLLKFYNFDIYQSMKDTGNAWVVRQNIIQYLVPALFNERVLIQTCLHQTGKSGLTMEAVMFRPDREEIKAVLWGEFMYVNMEKGKPVRHEPLLQELLDAVVTGEKAELALFPQRVKYLRKNFSFG